MPRYSTGQAKQPDKLNQRFSFTGKLRGADVLRRLVEVCGYDLLRRTLDEWEAAEMQIRKAAEKESTRRKAKKASS